MMKGTMSGVPAWVKPLLPVAIIFLLFTSCIEEEVGKSDWEINVGSRAPKFEVVMNDGSVFTTESDQPSEVLIVFFNTGCVDCRGELPQIQKLYEKIQSGESAPMRIVCIARQEDEPSIAKYWSDNGLTLPYSPQPDRRIFSMFASAGIPRLYLLSTDNIILSASQTLEDLSVN